MGAAVTLRRRLEWADTDATGAWHNTALWRYLEDAERELLRGVDLLDLLVRIPRRRVEAEFLAPVRFDDEVTVRLEVAAVGRTSIAYALELEVDGATVARASAVVVHVDGEGRSTPLPPDVASRLVDGA